VLSSQPDLKDWVSATSTKQACEPGVLVIQPLSCSTKLININSVNKGAVEK
jgi:hypothetical protein